MIGLTIPQKQAPGVLGVFGHQTRYDNAKSIIACCSPEQMDSRPSRNGEFSEDVGMILEGINA